MEGYIKTMGKHKLIFFTGAGISFASGIPTFDEQPDLRNKLDRNFALTHPNEYRAVIAAMRTVCDTAKPNAAHYAIANMHCPVITMNIDGLHRKAGTSNLIEVHGRLPEDHELYADNFNRLMNIPVLYGDPAPAYQKAYDLVRSLEYNNSYFVIVGTSFFTRFSEEIKRIAEEQEARIIIINDNAEVKVPEICSNLRAKLF